MNKVLIITTAALIGISASAVAVDDMKMGMKMNMKMLDANSDGMIFKEEFMKHHEMMYEKMKKNKSGMVDLKDVSKMAPHDMNTMGKGKPKEGAKAMEGTAK